MSISVFVQLTVVCIPELLCIADRENGRIQCTDLRGNFKHSVQSPMFNRLFAVEYSPADKVLYAVNGEILIGVYARDLK